MNKYFPNFEVISTFGGTPFKLKQQFEVPYYPMIEKEFMK